jgi:adenosylhomocysteine nucleosidase
MIVILIPSHFEAKTFLAMVEEPREAHIGGADFTKGKIGATEVTVGLRTSPGFAVNAGPSTGSELAKVRGVILMGFAGALDPNLKRGEIFITAGAEYILPHRAESDRPKEAKLATVDKIAGTAESKKELFEKTGAQLCDMEQTHVAEIAKKLGLPFVGIRIVSDEAQENLPADTLSQSYDQETGTYTPWKMAGHLTRNPFKTVPLVSFVRLLPPVRNHMSQRLHKWLTASGPQLFR